MSEGIVHEWLCEPMPADVRRALERLARCDDVVRIAVMPDVHLAHDVCVGTVLATSRLLYPSAVGGDIGCGMAAMAFEAEAALLAGERDAAALMAGLYRAVPSNRHRSPRELPEGLAGRELSHPSLEAIKGRDGRVQLGTLGRGNHFLEFQADAEGRLWVMVHTGSRGVGQAIRDWHLEAARTRLLGGMGNGTPLPVASAEKPRANKFAHATLGSELACKAPTLVGIDADAPDGVAYRADMAWALEYALANRAAILDAVVEVVRELFGVESVAESRIDCHHNFVRRETHFGAALWVHRKGAVPAAVGELGIIPGSMGSVSFHTRGRGCAAALCSSSHGAGRAMSRDEARRRIGARELERQMGGVWFDRRRAAALRDEAPGAYKDVRAVMRAQRELTRVVRELRPVLSYKGV